jgi:hypothetical protein
MVMELQIHVRKQCETCHGSGVIEHPLWSEYHRLHETAAAAERWFSGLGFDRDHIPPEECHCWDCDGSGYVSFWLGIDSARAEQILTAAARRGGR